jgi:hypothetical protein
VPVPPPQQAQDSRPAHSQLGEEQQARSAPRGPVWGMGVVFLVLLIGETIESMPAEFAIGSTLAVAASVLFSGGAYYVSAREEGVTFREALFNWPLVALAGVVALLILI